MLDTKERIGSLRDVRPTSNQVSMGKPTPRRSLISSLREIEWVASLLDLAGVWTLILAAASGSLLALWGALKGSSGPMVVLLGAGGFGVALLIAGELGRRREARTPRTNNSSGTGASSELTVAVYPSLDALLVPPANGGIITELNRCVVAWVAVETGATLENGLPDRLWPKIRRLVLMHPDSDYVRYQGSWSGHPKDQLIEDIYRSTNKAQSYNVQVKWSRESIVNSVIGFSDLAAETPAWVRVQVFSPFRRTRSWPQLVVPNEVEPHVVASFRSSFEEMWNHAEWAPFQGARDEATAATGYAPSFFTCDELKAFFQQITAEMVRGHPRDTQAYKAIRPYMLRTDPEKVAKLDRPDDKYPGKTGRQWQGELIQEWILAQQEQQECDEALKEGGHSQQRNVI